ncbi:MAG: hypothetical protein JST51_06125 [Armatimonadetes bacterium]|nr:hypothetical protein [Armatimonadota bacterium]
MNSPPLWKTQPVMGASVELYAACAGIAATTLASAAWWRVKTQTRTETEAKKLHSSVPSTRDGLLLSALVVEVYNEKGPVTSHEPWLGDLWVLLDGIVSRHALKKVGTYQSTYMVAATEQRIAEEALMLTAGAALDIRDAVKLFVANKDIEAHARFGIHADIIPTVGLGSTVALSELWNTTMELAVHAGPHTIELSGMAAEWLGPEFDIELLGEHPVLQMRKSA